MTPILHICPRAAWDAAQSAGEYSAPSLATEGYIHCSTSAQMQRTANKYYAGVRGLALLVIDPAKVAVGVREEPSGSWLAENPGVPHEQYTGELYPHIYGVINLDSVLRVVAYEPDSEGSFGPVPG